MKLAAYTVYADVLWLVNFVLDWALLAATARFGGFICRWWRLALAAAIGAFYGVGLLYPALALFYAMPLPLMFPLVMLPVGFGFMRPHRFGWLLLCFYLLSLVMGGAALAVRFLWGQGLAFGFGAGWLLPALLTAAGFSALGVGWFRRQLRQSGQVIRAEISYGGSSVSLPCFLDSGNTLREPLCGRPVLLVELSAARFLPGELYRGLYEGTAALARGEDFKPYELLLRLKAAPFAGRLLLIPYAGVEGAGQLGLAFLPDAVRYYMAGGQAISPAEPPIVLPVGGPLRGIYGARALINPSAVFGNGDFGPAPLLADEALCEMIGEAEEQRGRVGA